MCGKAGACLKLLKENPNGMLRQICPLVLLVGLLKSMIIHLPHRHLMSDADKAIVDNKSKVTESQLRKFLDLCWVKYVKARIEPGNP